MANPDDADVLAWMAESLRREGQYVNAANYAQMALTVDPDHAFAMSVLGDLYNPQFVGARSLQDLDDSLRMYRAALDIDPYDCQALLGLFVWSMNREDQETASVCLLAMDESGLWPDSIQALARWVLESAPEGAILVLSGDSDAYPIWALQERGIRTDVLICHQSLLNHPDYRKVAKKAGVPLPAGKMKHIKIPGEGLVMVSKQVLKHLIHLNRDGDLGRPLAFAITVSSANLPPGTFDESYLRGGAWVHDPAGEISDIDVEATRPLMEFAPPEVVSGTWISLRERSPVRLSSNKTLRFNPMNVVVRAFRAAYMAEQYEMADWYRDLYDAYRRGLGPFANGDDFFKRFDELPALESSED